MNRQFSRRTQGILLVVIGAVAAVGGVLLELFDHHLDSYLTWKTPVLIVVGVIALIVGFVRLRGRITR
jgi:lipopolysaccharide export LptBFGC system permease protein LptF